jgi:hypothetical protein
MTTPPPMAASRRDPRTVVADGDGGVAGAVVAVEGETRLATRRTRADR